MADPCPECGGAASWQVLPDGTREWSCYGWCLGYGIIQPTAYCGTCRTEHTSESPIKPPHAVIHRYNPDGTHTHLHPITREVMRDA